MKLSDRDKILAMILPAILVLVGYLLFVFKGKLAEQSALANAVVAAEKAAPSAEQLQQQQRVVAQLMKEQTDIQAHLDACQARWKTALGNCASHERRNARMDRLTQLLRKHDLALADDREADAAKEGKLPAPLERLVERVAESTAGQKPQLRYLRFQGRYADVQQALEELAQGEEVTAIPVGLTMKTIDDPERREWTLLLWI